MTDFAKELQQAVLEMLLDGQRESLRGSVLAAAPDRHRDTVERDGHARAKKCEICGLRATSSVWARLCSPCRDQNFRHSPGSDKDFNRLAREARNAKACMERRNQSLELYAERAAKRLPLFDP